MDLKQKLGKLKYKIIELKRKIKQKLIDIKDNIKRILKGKAPRDPNREAKIKARYDTDNQINPGDDPNQWGNLDDALVPGDLKREHKSQRDRLKQNTDDMITGDRKVRFDFGRDQSTQKKDKSKKNSKKNKIINNVKKPFLAIGNKAGKAKKLIRDDE